MALVLMLRSLTTWLYDEDPLALVAFETPLEALKRTVSVSSSYFESLIERYFLNNVHRTSLLLRPDPDMAKELERMEKERLSSSAFLHDSLCSPENPNRHSDAQRNPGNP